MTQFERLLQQWATITDHRIAHLLMNGAHSAIFLCAGEEMFRSVEYEPTTGAWSVTEPTKHQLITDTMMVNLFRQAVPPYLT